jgi:aryl-alcohol dehydrogenase-like predicted oxidoreductase
MSEKMIGEVLKERGDREDVILATKVYPLHLGFDNVLKACNASLRRLQTDRIDLYQIHAPSPNVPVSETMVALRTLLDDGKVRYAGVSNFQVSMTEVAINSLDNHQVISNQMEYSLLSRDIEKSILQHARFREMPILAYSPLASGFLTGKYSPGFKMDAEDRRNKWPLFSNRENPDVIKPLIQAMGSIGEKHGATVSEVAISWILHNKDIIPLPGAKATEHVDSHVRAAGWKMSDAEWKALSDASMDLRLNLFYNFGNA